MDIDYFLRTKYEENQVEGILRTEELYKNISNTYLKHLFAVMHQSINGLLSFMQSKKNSNGHYNAAESRELLRMIKLYEDMEYVLSTYGGKGVYTVESLQHLQILNETAVRLGMKITVLIRVTSGNQFGVDEADIRKIISDRTDYPGVEIEGLQFYSGTQKISVR